MTPPSTVPPAPERPEQNRVELDPPATTAPKDEGAAPPERREQRRADAPDIQQRLDRLIEEVGGDPASFDGRMVRELLIAGLKLIPDGRDSGELKLITAAVKELRYAYRVFGQYPEPHKVTIFGSARTRADHPDYTAAVEFSRLMADRNWMVITGAGDGIMKAGHVGPGRKSSFGVAIRLPFETTANDVIAGDDKLIHFRYFFTRKLMFISQAEAVALFPGGFGTLDEAYEVLTLIQTGKASMIPVVLLEGAGGAYWQQWQRFTMDGLLARGMISPEDLNLYHVAHTPRDAAEHIVRFYRVYHSSRYVRDDLVIRMKHRLRDADVSRLNDEFAVLVKKGAIVQRGALDAEDDNRDLPRLVFHHTRYKYGLVRKLIDRINECPGPEQEPV
ncbi:MAG: LOG family protein [Phycisphaerales bacterium]|nr:LOG family protein [Phycisphaerales bacterium]